MLKITNLGALFCLIFFIYHRNHWVISINENNLLSKYIVTTTEYLPITLLFIITIVVYIYAIIRNSHSFLLYLLSLVLLQILSKISLNTLLLENTTTFFFFKVTTPISFELKLIYIDNILADITRAYPELASPEFYNHIRAHLNFEAIKDLNCTEISEYIYTLVNATKETTPFQETFRTTVLVAIILALIDAFYEQYGT